MSAFKKNLRKKKQPFLAQHSFLSSKWLIGVIVVGIISVSAFVGTFAWFASADQRVNPFKGTQLVSEIDEVFTPNEQWTPGTQTKEVRVKNTGKTPAMVRLSLYEFLATFQVSVSPKTGTGTGNLTTVDASIQPTLEAKDPLTWQAAATAHGTYEKEGSYYVTESALVSDPINKTGQYEYNDPQRKATALQYITLNFSTAFKETVPTEPEASWVYEKGYFYYLVPLQPGEESAPLLNSVTLASTIPNQYKGALYQLQVYMDAHDETQPLLDAWQVEKTGAVYPLLAPQLK